MIARFTAFVLILFALGFALYAVTPGDEAPRDAQKVDAIIVLTGGKGRIERGTELLKRRAAKRMLIAGADPLVTEDDLVRRVGASRKLFDCCVDLGSESVDTRSNADEAARWIARNKVTSIRLVTSDWHMRRAQYEFRHRLGKRVTIVPDAVKTEPQLATLFLEYNKYLLRRLSVLLDL